MLNKQRDKEKQEMIKNRNSRYKNTISFDKDRVPDFELQLPTNFNLKFKRSDALGVRNLIIDENELLRAHRPDMDKLIILSKLRHEVKDSKHFETPTSNDADEIISQFDRIENIQKQIPIIHSKKNTDTESKTESKHESISMDRSSKNRSKLGEVINKNYKGKQDIGKCVKIINLDNAFNGIRKNFYPTYGVTYMEQKKLDSIELPSSYHPGYKLLNASTKKLLNSNSNSIDLNMKLKGQDYASSLDGVHMKRRDYELRNMSLENLRPFYTKNDSQHSLDVNPQRVINQEKSDSEIEMEMLKKKVYNSLLIHKAPSSYNENDDKSLIGPLRPFTKGKIKLPKLRENITLHITSRGTTVVQSRYSIKLYAIVQDKV